MACLRVEITRPSSGSSAYCAGRKLRASGPGARVHLGVGLAAVPGSIEELTDARVVAVADRPVALVPGTRVAVMDLSVPAGPRIVGSFALG